MFRFGNRGRIRFHANLHAPGHSQSRNRQQSHAEIEQGSGYSHPEQTHADDARHLPGGTAPKESATVDLLIDKDSLTSAQQYAQSGNAGSKYDIYKTGVLLDKKYYDKLPETLTIPNGSREATTQLVLHNAEIFADYPVGQILLLPVRIANPTRYTLNHSLSLTMVVITLAD